MRFLYASFFMFIPTILISAIRLQIISANKIKISLSESLKLVLAGSSLNMVLPSKMGDIAKGYFIAEKSNSKMSEALSLVVYEKTCDMLALLFYCVIGLIFYNNNNDMVFIVISTIIISGFIFGLMMISSYRFYTLFFKVSLTLAPSFIKKKITIFQTSWVEMCAYISQNKVLKFKIGAISVLLWFIHLLQIWLFIRMINNYVPLITHMAIVPLAIFTGLLPFTFAGIGVRDAALIYFFKGYLSSSVSATLGILCTLRYIVPAILGLPFLGKYLSKIKKMKK
jgi:hypothetical protein